MRPALNDPLVETSCVSCGNCIDSCPTGALEAKMPFPGQASLITSDVTSTCGFCSLGCTITVKRLGENRYYIEPSGAPGEYLCHYGRFGSELFIKQDRIAMSLVREEHQHKPVQLSTAIEKGVAGLRQVAAEHGAQSVAVFVSPELCNEEMYLAARIAREGLGTNNVGSLSNLGTGKDSGVLDSSFGFTASTSDAGCLHDADLIVCNNTMIEADHLVLAVDVIKAVKNGAKIIISNSTLDISDNLLSGELVMDPMRGRAALLWNGIIQLLLEDDFLAKEKVSKLTGYQEFMTGREFSLEQVADQTGIEADQIRKAAASISAAGKIVFIHSPDRLQDQSPSDMRTLANFVLLLRAVGVDAQLLLPRNNANSAGLEVNGADPAFLPGREAAEGLPGAASALELRELLQQGTIKGALIIGEDPLSWNRTSGWFQNLEFLVAMDWTDNETTHFADVVLPGSTFLETAGTRCNYLGEIEHFTEAIEPPAGFSGRDALTDLATAFGIEDAAADADNLTELQLEKLGDMAAFYWNSGQQRLVSVEREQLVAVDSSVKSLPIQPPLTHADRYKRELREIGTERFRVHQ
jgi:predicted molibdopterin-dependent oxidoreductase YjgC